VKNSDLKISLFIFSFLLFFNSLFGSFVFDDRQTILNHPQIQKITNLPLFLFSPYFFQKPQSGIYRPLTMTTYTIDHLWLKTNSAFFFHLTNVLLHSFNVVLVFILVQKLFKNKKLSFFTALLFASHPIHTEAVSWISGRPELLAFFFALLSIIFFLKKKWLQTNIFLLLALFSKETAIILIPLYIYLFFSNKPSTTPMVLGKKLKQSFNLNSVYCLLFTVCIYFSFRWLALGKFIFSNDATIVENPLKFAASLPRIFTALKIAVLYFVKLIFPLKLSADYSFNQIPIESNFWNHLTIIGFAFLVFAFCSLLFTKKNIIRFGLFFLLFPYLLISNLIFPIGTIMGERLMYFPSLGFCLLLAFFLLKLPSRRLLSITIAIIITFYFFRTFLRNFDWLSEFKLYQSMAKASPKSVLARSNLGGLYIMQNQWEKGKKELVDANQICQCYPHALNNLGLIYQHEEDLEKAEEWFKKAVEIDPHYQLGYKNLGILYFNQDRFEQAKKQFEKILPGNENSPEILYWLNQINRESLFLNN